MPAGPAVALPSRGDLRIRGLVVRHDPDPVDPHRIDPHRTDTARADPGVSGPGMTDPGMTDTASADPGPVAPAVLDGFDLDLPAGARIALVGASGAGKSTLASVLFRFLDPDAGSVTLDGADLLGRAPYAVRAVVSGVPQDPHVFDSTVRENVRLARPEATDRQLREVLDRVGLTGLDLDAPVGVHGARLSGGMRRRLAVSRALLTDPAVLVLDEPTAHLDPQTRDAVLDDLFGTGPDSPGATAGRSVLLITHDPACMRRADAVRVLRDGRAHPAPAPCVALTSGSAPEADTASAARAS